ncbi:MAG: polyprenyl diphosphate synthase [Planctomycetota bacterium]
MLHVAIIMDGNGRWARERGLPRSEGHHAGVRAVRRTVRMAPSLGITTLTLFALSSDNWRRPQPEIDSILDAVRGYLDSDAADCARSGVRLSVIGRRDRLPLSLLQAIERAEAATAGGSRLHLRLAVDYSSRDAIVEAARAFHVRHAVGLNGNGAAHEAANGAGNGATKNGAANGAAHGPRTGFGRLLAHERGADEVDLLVRTGGEQRLSDFLLWECAYAELVFSRRMWPDFDGPALRRAVMSFRARERRFGGVARSDAR